MKRGKRRETAVTIAEKLCRRRRRRRHSQEKRFFEQNARKIIVVNFNLRISLILLSVFSCHALLTHAHIQHSFARYRLDHAL